MKRGFISITIIITFTTLIGPVRAVDSELTDRIIFLLHQPEWNMWSDAPWDDETLIEGLSEVHSISISDNDDGLRAMAVWAMGETGLTEFVPLIAGDLEFNPIPSCYALGKIGADESVDALIGILDDDDKYVRDSAVWGLGNMPYTLTMEESRKKAIDELNRRLAIETEDWISEKITAAIILIETGLVTHPAFEH